MPQDVDTKLLELLVCPITKEELILSKKKDELISRSTNLAYPIREGVPILIPEEARVITKDDK